MKARRGMGETQCYVDPATGGRVCTDMYVPGAAQSSAQPATSMSDETTAENANLVMARASRTSRIFPGYSVDQAQALLNAGYVPAAQAVAASTPAVTATDALSSLSTSISSAFDSLNLTGSTWVSFLPNWAVLLGVAGAGYYLTHKKAARGRYR